MSLLDLLTVVSYLALNADMVLQIRRIRETKSSQDLSLAGMTVRYAAVFVILIKFISLGDTPLLLGQLLIIVIFTIYFYLALLYRRNRVRPPEKRR